MKFIKKLLPFEEFTKTVLRFPESSACCFVLFILTVLLSHRVLSIDTTILIRLFLILVFGFFWFGLARLLAEGIRLSSFVKYILSAAVFCLFAAAVFLIHGGDLAMLFVLTIPSLFLGLSIGPYLTSKDDLSFWFYNRQIWQGASVAFAASLIWWMGLSSALLAVVFLFGVNVAPSIYSDFWAFSAILLAPLYALSWVPHSYNYKTEDCHAPPQLAFVLNWVLAPLVLIYMLILYAYFFKIIMVGELPRGQLSYMVMIFGGVGVITYLSGWPLRNSGGPLLTLFYKVFFPALLVPVLMQMLSIVLRIEQYGVTEQRYIVALSSVWLAFLVFAYSFKKIPLKWMPGVLSLMLLVAAIGPLSAASVAERSQMARLESLLEKNNILVDGKITQASEEVSFADRKSIGSILTFLHKRKKMDRIVAWIPEDLVLQEVSPAKGEKKIVSAIKLIGESKASPEQITGVMGFGFVGYRQRPQISSSTRKVLRSPKSKNVLNIEGFKLVTNTVYGRINNSNRNVGLKRLWEYKDDSGTGFVSYYEDNKLYVGIKDDVIGFDVVGFALKEIDENPDGKSREMILDKKMDNLRVKLIFNRIDLQQEQPNDEAEPFYYLNTFDFRALVGY